MIRVVLTIDDLVAHIECADLAAAHHGLRREGDGRPVIWAATEEELTGEVCAGCGQTFPDPEEVVEV